MVEVGIDTLVIAICIRISIQILNTLRVIEIKYLVVKKLTAQQKNENKRLS